jgi:protein SCO1/2
MRLKLCADRRRGWIRGVLTQSGLALAILTASVGLVACSPGSGGASAKFQGADLTGASYAKGFELPDSQGKLRNLAEFKGKAVLVFFGFTQCPDVCPTTLTDLVKTKALLGSMASKFQVVFITLDPERDTPQILSMYLSSFDPTFVALRGDEEQTAAVAKDFKVFYTKVPGRTQGSYSVDHSAGMYLFDPQGRLRVFERHGTAPDVLAADLKLLINP